MAKQKCPECPKCLPGWLVQFGDLMSLLLTFFILLLSMAVMDSKKIEEYFDIMKKSMGFLDQNADVREQTDELSDKTAEDGDNDETSTDAETTEAADEVAEAMKEFVESSDVQLQIDIVKGTNEFTLDIPSALMFDEGEYEITTSGARRFISKVARIIRTMPQTFNIEVTGHTDRTPLRDTNIPRDNWDISSLRAISVVKELIRNRIDPTLLKVSSYASYRPKSSNPEDNRRVEIRFFADKNQKDMLEEENFFDRLDE